MLRASSSSDLLTSIAQIAVKYDKVDNDDDKSVENLSKSRKTLRAWKVAKVISSEEPNFLTFDI